MASGFQKLKTETENNGGIFYFPLCFLSPLGVSKNLKSRCYSLQRSYGIFKMDLEFRVQRKRGRWLVTKRNIVVGAYSSKQTAENACDIENFTANGPSALHLYSAYRVDSYSLNDSSFIITNMGSNDSYVITSKQSTVAPAPSYYIHDSIASHYVSADGFSWKYGPKSWIQRQSSAFVQTCGFCYDITFPHQQSLGLNLRPQHIMYSEGSGAMFLGCLAVVDASAFLSTIVCPGDILLRVNDIELYASGDVFDFDKMTRVITSAAVPRTVRFLRSSDTPLLCPAELELALKITPAASLNIVQNNTTQSLHVASVDSKVFIVSIFQSYAASGTTSYSQIDERWESESGINDPPANIPPDTSPMHS